MLHRDALRGIRVHAKPRPQMRLRISVIVRFWLPEFLFRISLLLGKAIQYKQVCLEREVILAQIF